MLMNEYGEGFLDIENILKSTHGELFDDKWSEVRHQQFRFLIERPLLFKVISERYWGPARLNSLWTNEWWEIEEQSRKSNKSAMIEELADMALLLLTMDSLKTDLLLEPQVNLLTLGWTDTVKRYCEEIGICQNDLIPVASQKIQINSRRNPIEAYGLVPGEDMHTAHLRLNNNWKELKAIRDKMPKRFYKSGWWKKWLFVDINGNLQKRG